MLAIAVQLSIVLFAALIGGIVSHRFKQPLVVGYLVVGVILGNVLSKNFVQSSQIAFFGELGVALLLFSLGLEFSIKRISAVYKIAVFGGILQIVISAILGFLIIPLLIHTSNLESIFVSLLIAFSSTAVVAKILAERGALDSLHGEILLGWLIIQDIAVLPVMALFPLFTGADLPFKSIILILLKPLLVLYLVLFIGRRIMPRVFTKLALLHNRELMVILSFSFCILFSLGAMQLGLSFALGAFLAGICLSSAQDINNEIFSEIKSIRDIFAAVFFVALGFLVNAQFLCSHIFVILAVSLLILIIKFVVVFGLVMYLGYHSKVAFLVGVGLVQIGEFSFVLAKLGFDNGVLSSNAFQIVISSAVLTIILTPFLFNKADFFYDRVRKLVKSKMPRIYDRVFIRFNDTAIYAPKDDLKDMKKHTVIVGYGRVGRAVSRALDLAKASYVVVDLNYHNLKYLRNRGVPNIFGDAEDSEILKLAKLEKAKVLVIAKPGKEENEHILRIVRRINPSIKIVMRVHSENEAAHFVIEGVKDVVEPEFSAAMDIAKRMLYLLDVEEEVITESLDTLEKEHKY